MKRSILLLLALACATARPAQDHKPYGGLPEGATKPVALCSPMTLPPDERSAHLFSMTYVVRADGGVAAAQMINPVEPRLKTAALAWLTACRHQPAMLDGAPITVRQHIDVFVHPPEDAGERIVDAQELPAEVRQRIAPARECAMRPMASHYTGRVRFSFVVHRDGRASDLAWEDRVPNDLSAAIAKWLGTCPYRAVELAGERVAVRFRTALMFDEGAGREWDPDRPQIHRRIMTRPLPLPGCEKPSFPEPAGTVVLDYVIDEDGRAHDFVVKNPEAAPQAVVDAVEAWLSECRFRPSIANGLAIPVRILQPFVVK